MKFLYSKVLGFAVLSLICSAAFGQTNHYVVEPPFWYKGLGSDTLMLLIHSKNVANTEVTVQGEVAKLIRVKRFSSQNYVALFLWVNRQSKDSTCQILFNKKTQISYVFKSAQAFNAHKIRPSDNMYMIMPDRFANGNPENDHVKGYFDKPDRQLPKGRHGGDLQGIINHLDYLENLGVTSLWINPLLENNQKVASYHGYAATNLYAVDARFGSLQDYQRLSKMSNERGIGLVMDVVYNHIGSEHPWMSDLPDSSWINFHPEFTQSNYRAVAPSDPHASNYDKRGLTDGWFVPTMPDLNQRNALLSMYLIQNTLWWIQTAQLSGLRIDTYAYPDNDFMKKLVNAIKTEFPECFVFGEIWEIGDAAQAWYGPNTIGGVDQQGLDGITDYQLFFAINKWLQEEEGWSEGLGRIYYALAADILYMEPNNQVTFLDNHDQDRFFGKVENDFQKWKQGIGFLLTTRGTPCIYYGTELLFDEVGDHGLLRRDFPGGWPNDTVNKFKSDGRTEAENEAFNFLQTLMLYRKTNPELFESNMVHFVPEKGLYVYFRTSNEKNLMVVISNASSDQVLELERFEEVLPTTSSIQDIFSKVISPATNSLWIPAGSIYIGAF